MITSQSIAHPAPMTNNPRRYERPEQVHLCYQATRKGDLDGVKEQVRRLLHDHEAVHVGQQPRPEWLFSSLSEAISRKNIEIVQFLIEEKVAGDDLPGDDAVRAQAFDILKLFLRYGWDINKPLGRNQPSVLGIPLSTSDEEMVTWLLDHGANPNSRCEWDLTPTSYAMLKAPLETIDKLFQRGADSCCGQLLHYAVLRDNPDALAVVRRVVEEGAPINEVKYEKDPKIYSERKPFGLGTPLHRAAEFGKLDIVKYLLEKGANPLKLDSKERTPRFWAEQKSQTEVARILEEAENHWP